MAARAPRIETREKRRIGRIAVACGLTALLLAVQQTDAWRAIDGRVFDLLSTISPPRPPGPSPVLVAIDEPSFSALGQQWPWPREIHAALIEQLRAAEVRAIGLDVVFADPSNPAGDAALAGAAGSDTIFAADETVIEAAHGTSLIRTEPLPALLSQGARSGVASVSLDGDGVLRRLPRYPDGFAATLVRASGAKAVPSSGRPRLIQYFGPAGSYPRISYYQALDPRANLPPGLLRGRTVIVGYGVQASADLASGPDAFETPYTASTGQLTQGLEVQATIFDNLRHGLSIATLPGWLNSLGLVIAAILAFLFARSPHPGRKLAASLVAVGAAIVGSWLLLRFGRTWFSPAAPAAGMAVVTAGLAARDYVLERRLRHDVQNAFAQYLSPTIIERLVEDPALLRLGGETREMTILFADIRGFTTISESMKDDPEELVRIINRILTPLSQSVADTGGTIDKYIGDCVMAFWNAPLDDPEHALHAVEAALAMLAALDPINAEMEGIAGPFGQPLAIRIGIGINTGPCVVGNIGSDQRFDYSVLGDVVNTASRLESASKEYGKAILLGETTAELVKHRVPLEEVARVTLRGKQTAQTVYALAEYSGRVVSADQVATD